MMGKKKKKKVLDFIVGRTKLSEDVARKFFKQLVLVLEYCHGLNIAHRDLKAENMLLDSNLNIKLIDFGLSNTFTPGILMKTPCGSPTYAAPELIHQKPYRGSQVDVWSLGVVLYVFVCGKLPFTAKDLMNLFLKITKCEYELPDFLSPGSFPPPSSFFLSLDLSLFFFSLSRSSS
jgi:serine/threonine protein kinase